MSRRQPRGRTPLYDTRPYRLVTVVNNVVAIIVAYVFTIFVYAVAAELSRLPSGPLWDASFQTPVFVVLLAIVVCVLLVPLFQREATAQVRVFGLCGIAFILGFAFMQKFHMGDPALPLRFLLARFDAFRRQFGY